MWHLLSTSAWVFNTKLPSGTRCHSEGVLGSTSHLSAETQLRWRGLLTYVAIVLVVVVNVIVLETDHFPDHCTAALMLISALVFLWARFGLAQVFHSVLRKQGISRLRASVCMPTGQTAFAQSGNGWEEKRHSFSSVLQSM